jgi:AcrR family transcriptional regulator
MGRRAATPEAALRSDAQRNRERVIAAAIAAFHRDGSAVPMATIAADAGVGVGTLYRHFATREELVEELTHRSMNLMLTRIEQAIPVADTGVDAFRIFLTADIGDRNDMVLSSTGGPAAPTARSRAVQDRLHDAIRAQIARGNADGTIKRDIDVWDIAWLGATLAQPGRPGSGWDRIAERLLDTYLAGLSVE